MIVKSQVNNLIANKIVPFAGALYYEGRKIGDIVNEKSGVFDINTAQLPDNILKALNITTESDKIDVLPYFAFYSPYHAYIIFQQKGLTRQEIARAMSKPYDRILRIPKRKGGYRTVLAPNPAAREIQKILLEVFTPFANQHYDSHAYSYIKGKSIATLAHDVNQVLPINNLVSLDLKDFFEQITKKQVIDIITKKFGWNFETANYLTRFLFGDRNRLPQGSLLSPMFSNIAFADTDKKLAQLVKPDEMYARYSDDILFFLKSSDPGQVKQTAQDILKQDGWKINTRKVWTRRVKKALGISFESSECQPTRQLRRSMRGIRHILKKYWEPEKNDREIALKFASSAYEARRLLGLANWAGQIHEEHKETFKLLHDVFKAAGLL